LLGVERITAVHCAAVVPQHNVADPPDVLPGELRQHRVAPELVQQRLGIGKVQPDDISVPAAAQIEHALAGIGMRARQRMHGTR